MMQFPETASIVEAERPNAKGKMVLSVHALGCAHTHLFRGKAARGSIDVLDVTDPAKTWVQPEGEPVAGVAGAVSYMLAVKSGLMDDGVDNGAWIARLAPCAKKEI